MKLIVKTGSTNEFSEGCEYALVDLTPLLADTILMRKQAFDDLKRIDGGLDELAFWGDGHAEYFSRLPEDDDGETLDAYAEFVDHGEGFTVAPADIPDKAYWDAEEGDFQRTECDRMVIDMAGVRFRCYRKHCDWLVTTHEIDYATVAQAAQEEVIEDPTRLQTETETPLDIDNPQPERDPRVLEDRRENEL